MLGVLERDDAIDPEPARARARHRAHAARRPRCARRCWGGAMSDAARTRRAPAPPLWQRALPWIVTLVCFAWLARRIDGAAARRACRARLSDGVFASVPWHRWLALMIPYSAFFFLVDSTVVWRVVNWFNARVPWREILPIRASAYILSILNEQVGKGAMALYLNRRYGVPGWEVGSSMLFIMFCELLYLTFWALVGYAIAGDELPHQFRLVPWIALGVFGAVRGLGRLLPRLDRAGSALRERPILKAFREASPLRYLADRGALRSPGAARRGDRLHARAAPVRRRRELRAHARRAAGDLLRAAVPTPMRAAAITIWVVLFPEREAQMSAFGFVMHNFFIFFNATIGSVLPAPRAARAARDLELTRLVQTASMLLPVRIEHERAVVVRVVVRTAALGAPLSRPPAAIAPW
jgi:hypothetical protein